jgi:hypothetical protein
VLIYYCCSYCETSLPRIEIVLGEERASLQRGETVLGQERAKNCSCFLHICLMHMFPSDTSKDP